jgi:hypothetical protein
VSLESAVVAEAPGDGSASGERAKDFTGIAQTKIIIKHRHNMLIMVLLTRIQLRPSFRSVLLSPAHEVFLGRPVTPAGSNATRIRLRA